MVKKFAAFYGIPYGSLPWSQECTNEFFPEPDECIAHPFHILSPSLFFFSCAVCCLFVLF
jgi:hypothetical protein